MRWTSLAILSVVLLSTACGPRKTKLDVPQGLAEAQTASVEELLELVNNRYALPRNLTVTRFGVDFTSGSLESGYLKEYPGAKGHLVAERPSSIFINILNPVTSSTVVTMAAVEQQFQIWVPRENKYLIGRTDVVVQQEDPIFSVRPDHILDAILVEPLPSGDVRFRVFLEEDQDTIRKYYVLTVLDLQGKSGFACLNRKLWIERQNLRLIRQQYYDCGELESRIEYNAPVEMDSGLINTGVSVERIRERYKLALRFQPDTVRLNRELKASTFEVRRPPAAEVVEVKGN